MDQPRPISIVIADDHPTVLAGLVGLLHSQPDLTVLEGCINGPAAVQAIRALRLPGRSAQRSRSPNWLNTNSG